MILGTEAYYHNDVDDRVVIHGQKEQPLEEEMVCFDIETTGLDRRHEYITEIGAVVLKNGEITDTYSAFLNPGKPIPRKLWSSPASLTRWWPTLPGRRRGGTSSWIGWGTGPGPPIEFDMGFVLRAAGGWAGPLTTPVDDPDSLPESAA